jgi:outer membrane protein
MNVDGCFREALVKNEQTPIQEENAIQAEETVKQGWGSIFPTVNYSQQWYWMQAPNATGPNSGNTSTYQPTGKFTASQPVFQGFREWEGLARAKSLFRQQKATTENVNRVLYQNVVAGYYNVLYLERDIANLAEEVKYLTDRIKELERFQKIGRSQLSDVLTAKTNLATLLVTEETDRITLKKAREAFALLTGLDKDVSLEDDAGNFNPTIMKMEFYVDRRLDRPDVRAAREGLKAADQEINVAKANHLPSVALVYDRFTERPANLQGSNWDASIQLTMPIFAGGVTQSQVRQAYSVSHQAQLTMSFTDRSAVEEIRSFYEAVLSGLKQNRLTTENIDMAEQTFKEEERTYRLGLVTNLDVLTALTAFIEAKRVFDKNRFQLKSDYLSLLSSASSVPTSSMN